MVQLVPTDDDPFAGSAQPGGPQLVPVDHDPFAGPSPPRPAPAAEPPAAAAAQAPSATWDPRTWSATDNPLGWVQQNYERQYPKQAARLKTLPMGGDVPSFDAPNMARRSLEGFQAGYGDQPVLWSPEVEKTIQGLPAAAQLGLKPLRGADQALRALSGVTYGAAGAAAGAAQDLGMSEAWASRLQRDLPIPAMDLGQGVPKELVQPWSGPWHGEVLPPERPQLPAAPRRAGPTIEGEWTATPREGLNIDLMPPEAPHEPPPRTTRAAAGAAGTPGRGPLVDMSPEAIERLREHLEEEGFTRDELGRGQLERRLEEMSQHQFLGELTPGMENRFAGLATHPGASRTEIENNVVQRGRESPDRMLALLDRTVGNYENNQDVQRALQAQREKESSPLFQAFRDTKVPPSPQLDELMPALRASGALSWANKALTLERRPLTNHFYVPGEEGAAAEVQQMPTAEAFQYAKEHLDSLIKDNAEHPQKARLYTNLKNALVEAIDNHPDRRVAGVWKQARDAYAQPSELIAAQNMGRDILTNNVHREELPYLTAADSPTVARNRNIGMRAHLEDLAASNRNPARQTNKLLDAILPRSSQEKLRWQIGDQNTNALVEGALHEEMMHNAPTRILYGAPTGARLAAQKEWGVQPSWYQTAGVEDVPLNVSQAAVKAVGAGVDWARQNAIKRAEARAAQLRNEAAKIYTLQGPERDAALRALLADPAGDTAQPLTRGVIERGRSGRPTRTEPLPIGTEQQILEQGYERSAPPPAQPGKAPLPVSRNTPPETAAESAPPAAPHVPLDSNPKETALTVNDILHPDYPSQPARSRNVWDIAEDLNNRGSDALKGLGVRSGRVEKSSPKTDETLSRAIASEIKAALARGGSASDWYTRKMQEAMNTAALIHPELATDPVARFKFTAALAVTSQGETVASNVRLADGIYQRLKDSGTDRFPTDVRASKQKSMNKNFEKLNDLIDAHGPEKTIEFLNNQYTVKQLKDAGYKIGGENMGTMVHGSAILGPKIGGGFFQNLNGNYNPVTMDLWFMRAWGRLTGMLKGTADMTKPRARFEAALRDEGLAATRAKAKSLGLNVDPDLKAESAPDFINAVRDQLGDWSADQLAKAAKNYGKIPQTMPALERRALDIMSKHEADFRANRAQYDSGEKKKSELTYAAERLVHNLNGLNETPKSGAQREWMRARVNRARELLANEGISVTNADLQAIWWYPEKDLYAKLGGRDSEGINVDYASAFRDLAKKQGISDDDIARAGTIRPVDQRPGRAGSGDDQRAEQSGRPAGGGAAVGTTPGEAAARPAGGSEGRAGGAGEAPGAAAPSVPAPRQAPLVGLPQKPIALPGGETYTPGPFARAHAAARDYMQSAGLPYEPPRTYQPVNVPRAERISQAFDTMKHDPTNPKVKASYAAMVRETMAQYRAIEKTGLNIEFIKPGDPDPYVTTPRGAQQDVVKNNHLWVYPTDTGFGSAVDPDMLRNHPMLRDAGVSVGGRRALVNDIFRIVHDYFGHIKDGNGFRADGEENAWRSHAAMYSPLARGAMTTETRGQNSWLNYGPHGKFNRTANAAETKYAPQKVGLLPEWVQNEGRTDPTGAQPVFDRTSVGSGAKGLPSGTKVVDIDPRAFERAFAATQPEHHSPLIKGRMDRLREHVAAGKPVSMAEVGANAPFGRPRVDVGNGRHRLRLAAEMGMESVPVVVHADEADALQDLIAKHGAKYKGAQGYARGGRVRGTIPPMRDTHRPKSEITFRG